MKPGDVISYLEMCNEEVVNLQRGMNYHLRGSVSVIVMRVLLNGRYMDIIEDAGRIMIYEGLVVSKRSDTPFP